MPCRFAGMVPGREEAIIGYVFVQIPWESHVIFTSFFNRTQSRAYWRHQAVFMLIALLICAATWSVVSAIPMVRIPGLLVKSVVAALISGILTTALFYKDMPIILEKVFKRS